MSFRGEGDWGVSTLSPAKNPLVTLFDTETGAIHYARQRALLSGSRRIKASGRTMYVIKYDDSDPPQGTIRYRALRGQRGTRQRPGGGISPDPKEQIMVFTYEGLLESGAVRWKLDKGLTIDVRSVEEEREKTRLVRGTRRMTTEERYGDR